MKNNVLILITIILTLNANEFNIDAILEDSKKDIDNTKIELKEFVKDSKESATQAQDDFYYKHQYHPEPSSSDKAKSWCDSIKNKDMRYGCYANVENKKSWCDSIKNEDMRYSCYANIENKKSWCDSIKYEDIRYGCYANVEK